MSRNEEHILKILRENKIPFEREKSFKDLKKGLYRYDFFINYQGEQIAIEVNGEQHYEQIKFFQKKSQNFLHQQENDRKKINYCLAHQIKLYIIPYWDIPNIYTLEDIFKADYLAISQYHNDKVILKRKKNV